MKLNIGCGGDRREGWVNADIRVLETSDMCVDVRRMGVYTNEQFDEVLAQDVLEHVGRNEVEQALSELHRVLKVDGRLCVRVPNLLFWADRISANPLYVDQALEAIYGEQDYEENTHKCGFTMYSLRKVLQKIGFKDIRVLKVDGCNLQALCRKPGEDI